MLNMFSCTSWLSVGLLWRNVGLGFQNAATSMDLEAIILSEVSLTEVKYHMPSLICEI